MPGPLIQSVELFQLRLPLTEPFVISLGPVRAVENLVVRLRTADGLTGYGECSPYPSINGETLGTCFSVGQLLGRALLGHDARDLAGATTRLDRVIYGNSSVKSAFDMALHDVAARHAGRPLYQLLGGTGPGRPLRTGMTVSLGPPAKMQADAVRFQRAGFAVIKVKLGESLAADVARIRAIRAGIGPTHPLRIDANQGWDTPAAALAVLRALAPFDIEFCEEPLARHRFLDLAALSAASPIPLMADESCGDEHDAARLIGLGACPLLNIKLGKSAGLHRAQKIVALGAAAGLGLQVGGFMESRLGMSAAAHLAWAHPAIRYCDFDTPLLFAEDPVVGGLRYGPGGELHLPPDAPGLGAVIAEEYLREAEKWQLSV